MTFGTEGESLTLVANMVVVPDLPNLPPEVMWYRDGKYVELNSNLLGFFFPHRACKINPLRSEGLPRLTGCVYAHLDTLLSPSRWAEMYVGGGAAKLTLPHLNKDDEGLYTLRVWTKDGTTEHSAYLFVKGLLQTCTFLVFFLVCYTSSL